MRYHGKTRRQLRNGLLGLLSLCSLTAAAADWSQIEQEAKGQTVWFNAWGAEGRRGGRWRFYGGRTR